MFFSAKVHELCEKIESQSAHETDYIHFYNLVKSELKNITSHPDVLNAKYKNTPYPTTSAGWARSFDPLLNPLELLQHYKSWGFVVAKNVASNEQTKEVVGKINEIVGQFDLNDPASYTKDGDGVAILSRGFVELHHDNCLAQIRQNPRLYLHHCLILNCAQLWCTFDRVGFKPSSTEVANENSLALGWHVDQNPKNHPGFQTIQGVLALEDCSSEVGCTQVALGSINHFLDYKKSIAPNYTGDFVPYTKTKDGWEIVSQDIAIERGCILTWDSRTTHRNSENTCLNKHRFVAYISANIAKPHDQKAIDLREQLVKSSLGANERFAYAHASKKPRFSDSEYLCKIKKPEELSWLGKRLYGKESYD